MKNSTIKEPAEDRRTRIITLRPAPGSSLQEIKVYAPSLPSASYHPVTVNGASSSYINIPNQVQGVSSLALQTRETVTAKRVYTTNKIPRPPNAFMMFANEWRKKLALQHPSENNKVISVRLGQLWKTMDKGSKEVYYQLSRQAGRDHKLKYPGYVYNPKEARMRKALREQSKGSRNSSIDNTRWPKFALTMNHQRQSLVSPVVLPQQYSVFCEDNKQGVLEEQVDGDTNMLQSYPDYLDLPYNVPSTDYTALDTQSWYPYLQPGAQSNGGGGYMGRTEESKLQVDWSTPYNSEQGNFIGASPERSPYPMQTQQEVPQMLMNGDHSVVEQTTACESNSSCLSPDCKPVLDQLVNQNNITGVSKDPEQHVKELLASSKVISDNSPVLNGNSDSPSDPNSTRLPGFHQAFGSTEIGRFSQPDGFFEAAVAAENERKFYEYTTSSLPSSIPFQCFTTAESPLFGFQELETSYPGETSPDFLHSSHLDNLDNFDPLIQVDEAGVKQGDKDLTNENSAKFEAQDLASVVNVDIGKQVIISENNNCCVVQLESSAIITNTKQYFSL